LLRTPKPVLCYVTDRRGLAAASEEEADRALLERVASAAAAGVDWIQLREKELATRRLVALTSSAVKAAPGRVVVNDRLDVAIVSRAKGVHLGGESLPVAAVVRWRKTRGSQGSAAMQFLVGASCHTLEAARDAERDGADYVFFGPIFPTPSKLKFGPPQGFDRLAEVCRALSIPVLAIGGITLENAAACLEAGAAGLAAIRLFQEAADLASVAARLRAC
jgi:thiamine-phosphate pyrophosphorylase